MGRAIWTPLDVILIGGVADRRQEAIAGTSHFKNPSSFQPPMGFPIYVKWLTNTMHSWEEQHVQYVNATELSGFSRNAPHRAF